MPLWTNRATGDAARNGTTSHTIPFGFTATSGRLLVAVLGTGAVQTVTGWTRSLQSLSGTELSVWTKTAAGGETSLGLTLSASNYPAHYEVFEYATGSSYVSGVQNGASTAWPTLSGLTGTNTIWAAQMWGFGSQGGQAATWSAPFVEAWDSFVAASGTDGYFCGGAYVEGATGASYQPVQTDGPAPAHEHVVFAVNVAAAAPASQTAAPTSTVTSTGWTTTGAASPHLALDEAAADDADFVSSPNNPTASPLEVGLASLTDPGVNTGHTVSYRFRSTGTSSTVVVALVEGTTVRASQSVTTNPATFTTGTFTLTEGEAAAITSYSDLRIRVTATAA